MTGNGRELAKVGQLMCSRCGYCDRSANGSFRWRQALTLHFGEQYTAANRRSTPAIQRTPHSRHSPSPTLPCTAARRWRSRRSTRHCLERQDAEQNTASGLAPGRSRSPQARQALSTAFSASLDTSPSLGPPPSPRRGIETGSKSKLARGYFRSRKPGCRAHALRNSAEP